MMNGWLWNFAYISGTMMPTMNVSNFGGDPVTQLNLKKIYSIILSVRRHVAILLGTWWMADYETLHVCRVPWCQQCVKFWWWPSDPLKLKKFYSITLSVLRHVAILLGTWWMADYETLHVCLVSSFMTPIMCHIFVVTQLNFKNVL